MDPIVVSDEDSAAWNAFVAISFHDPEELSAVQRVAHFAFIYESEVQNGGHLQYFENHGTALVRETLNALAIMRADGHHDCLAKATEAFDGLSRGPAQSVEEYVGLALEDEFGIFDQRYHDCTPALIDLLERYFEEHRSDFVLTM